MATVERSGVVMVLDRHGVHREPMRWLSERVELVEIATGTFAVVQHATERKPFAHVEGVPLEEVQAVYCALALMPRRASEVPVLMSHARVPPPERLSRRRDIFQAPGIEQTGEHKSGERDDGREQDHPATGPRGADPTGERTTDDGGEVFIVLEDVEGERVTIGVEAAAATPGKSPPRGAAGG